MILGMYLRHKDIGIYSVNLSTYDKGSVYESVML